MENCLNTDVIYQGMTFHVQTEDLGSKNGYFQIQTYYRGKILDSHRFDYSDLLEKEDWSRELEERIEKEHKKAVDQVTKGQINIEGMKPILVSSDHPDRKSGKIKIVAKAGRFGKKRARRSMFQTAEEVQFVFRRANPNTFGSPQQRRWVPVFLFLAVFVSISMIALPRPENDTSKEERFQKLLDQGEVLIKEERFDAAEETLNRVIAFFPDRSPGYVTRAHLFAAMGAVTRAIGDLRSAAELDPANGAIFFEMGRLHMEAHEYPRAIANLEKAIQAGYKIPEVYESLGMALFSAGDLHQSEKFLTESLKINPDNPRALNNLGLIALKRESYGEAIREFEAAIQRDPQLAEAYINLGNVFEMTGLRDKARTSWAKVLELDPENSLARAKLQSLR